jgi:hypothetical protein
MIRQLKGLDLNKVCLISVIYAHRSVEDSEGKPHESVRISSSDGDEEEPVLTSSGTTLCDIQLGRSAFRDTLLSLCNANLLYPKL